MPGVHHQSYICSQEGFRIGTKTENYQLNVVQNVRKRFTCAEVNAGDVIISGVPGKKIRLIDLALATSGGAPGVENIEIASKQGNSDVKLAVFVHGDLGDNDYAALFDGDTDLLDDGESLVANDVGEPIRVESDGVTTVGHVDIIATYIVEE